MGTTLMPWQVHVVTVGLEVQSAEAGDPEPGSWAYDTVGVSVQRQAGKTTILRPVIAHRMKSLDGARIWTTAQTGVHARRRWLDTTDALIRSPLREDLRRRTGVGHEELRWVETGSTLEPFAPNGESLHGETPVLVAVDELWTFDAEEGRSLRQAYRPGFLTQDAQAWLLSTAGDVTSAWLNQLRTRGRRAVEQGKQLGLAWFEWQLPDVVDGIPVDDLDDEALVEACIRFHPAYGFTLRPASVRAAWEEYTEEDYAVGRAEFLRAYGNRTPDGGRPRFYPRDVWERAGTEELLPPGRVALGFEVDVLGRESAITAVAALKDGRRIVEVIERASGSTWLVPRLLDLLTRHELAGNVTCNDAGPTREAADLLELAGVEVDRVTERNYAAASVRFDRELREPEPTVVHRNQPELDADGVAAGKRRIGGSWAYGPQESPVPALISATVALWAWDHAPEPEPESRFWIG